MHIGLVYNLRPENLERTDPKLEQFIEGDEWKTIKNIGNAIIGCGHTLTYLPIDSTIYHRLEKAKGEIDLLFNDSEGVSAGADREAHIPMICEILGIPYTGPSPLSAALILNKTRAKEIWQSHGIKTASWQIFSTGKESLSKNLNFPLLVKPNGEGSGIGIKSNSLVNNLGELGKAVNHVVTSYHQPALVEEYLAGREFTVSIVGNGKDLVVLPIIEINFASFPEGAPAIDTYEAKFVYGATGEVPMHDTEFCPAPLTKSLEKEIINLAKSAYLAIGCRDFGRLDIRLDSSGKPHVLEINHPPGLMSDPNESSFFTIAARVYGWDFTKTIGEILHTASSRLGLR